MSKINTNSLISILRENGIQGPMDLVEGLADWFGLGNTIRRWAYKISNSHDFANRFLDEITKRASKVNSLTELLNQSINELKSSGFNLSGTAANMLGEKRKRAEKASKDVTSYQTLLSGVDTKINDLQSKLKDQTRSVSDRIDNDYKYRKDIEKFNKEANEYAKKIESTIKEI